MRFEDVYKLVESKKDLCLESLLEDCNADLIYDNDLSHGYKAWSMEIDGIFMIYLQESLIPVRERFLILHELGHRYCDSHSRFADRRKEECAANLFACLYLLQNQIWQTNFFTEFLMCNGADKNIAIYVNDRIYDYKLSLQQQMGWKMLELYQ